MKDYSRKAKGLLITSLISNTHSHVKNFIMLSENSPELLTLLKIKTCLINLAQKIHKMK